MTASGGSTPPVRGRARRDRAVAAALDPAAGWDPGAVAAYARSAGVPADDAAVRGHLAGRFAGLEDAIARLMALASHTTPDRQVVLREALDALRAPYERALADALALRAGRAAQDG